MSSSTTGIGSAEKEGRDKKTERSLEEHLDHINFTLNNMKNKAFLEFLFDRHTGENVEKILTKINSTIPTMTTRDADEVYRNLIKPPRDFGFKQYPHITLHYEEELDEKGQPTGNLITQISPMPNPMKDPAKFATVIETNFKMLTTMGYRGAELHIPKGIYTAEQAYDIVHAWMSLAKKNNMKVHFSKDTEHYINMFNTLDEPNRRHIFGFPLFNYLEPKILNKYQHKSEDLKDVDGDKYVYLNPEEYIREQQRLMNSKHDEQFSERKYTEKTDRRNMRELIKTEKLTEKPVRPLDVILPTDRFDTIPVVRKDAMRTFMETNKLQDPAAPGTLLRGDAKVTKISDELNGIDARLKTLETAYKTLSERYAKLVELKNAGKSNANVYNRMLKSGTDENHTLKLMNEIEKEFKELKSQQTAWRHLCETTAVDGNAVTVANPSITNSIAIARGKDPKVLNNTEKKLMNLDKHLYDDNSVEKRLEKMDVVKLKSDLTTLANTLKAGLSPTHRAPR